MLVGLLSVIGKDKYIEHPILGSISCNGFNEAFKRCTNLMQGNNNGSIHCQSLYDISNFYNWYDVWRHLFSISMF